MTVILALTAAILLIQQPRYLAQASLLVEPTSDPVRTTEPGAEVIANVNEVDTEIKLISSPAYRRACAHVFTRQKFASPDGDRLTETEIELLAQRITQAPQVTRAGQTKVIEITAIDTDPAFAAVAANLLGEAYQQSQVAAKTSESASTSEFINARLKELETQRPARSDGARQLPRRIVALSDPEGASNAEQEVSNLNQQLASARAELAEKRGRFNAARVQLQQGGGGADVGAALGSGTISSLRQQEANVSAQVAVLGDRYGALHPDRRRAERELADIRQRIQEEINRVLSNLEAEVQTAESRVASLQGSRGAAIGSVTQNSRAQAGLSELEQKALASQTIYQSFLQRSQEAGALRDSAMPDTVITARATVPNRPFSPNYLLGALIGCFLAGTGGFGSILLAEYLRRGVQTKRDIEKGLGLRYAGAIPTLRSTLKKAARILASPTNTSSIIRIRCLLNLFDLSAPSSLCRRGCDRAYLPLPLPCRAKARPPHLSVSRARTAIDGVKTLLVDADLRRRGSSSLLGYDSELDIHDYLAGRAAAQGLSVPR